MEAAGQDTREHVAYFKQDSGGSREKQCLRREVGLPTVSGKEDRLTSFSTDVIVVPQHPHGGASSWKPLYIF
jgi:hypothetical protein